MIRKRPARGSEKISRTFFAGRLDLSLNGYVSSNRSSITSLIALCLRGSSSSPHLVKMSLFEQARKTSRRSWKGRPGWARTWSISFVGDSSSRTEVAIACQSAFFAYIGKSSLYFFSNGSRQTLSSCTAICLANEAINLGSVVSSSAVSSISRVIPNGNSRDGSPSGTIFEELIGLLS